MKNKKIELDSVPDKYQVLDYEQLGSIGEAFSILENEGLLSKEIGKVDLTDLNNLEKWYYSYRALYSYRSIDKKLSKNEQEKFDNIEEKNKNNLNISSLIEIAIGRYLEKCFFDNGDNVRVRKTTEFDDVNGSIDYVVELLKVNTDGKKHVSSIAGIDLTTSNNDFILFKKSIRKDSDPYDYLHNLKKKEKKECDFIPRFVLNLPKNLVYSFTNNYFTEIIEKGDALNNSELEKNLNFAIDDLKQKNLSLKNGYFSLQVEEVINESKQKAIKIL